MTITTLRVHIAKSSPSHALYVNAVVEVPGIGEIEMKDTVSQATVDALFAEVAAAAEMKIRGKIT